jgi:hypothetical protein
MYRRLLLLEMLQVDSQQRNRGVYSRNSAEFSRRYESVIRFMRFLLSVDFQFGCPSFFNQSHLSGRPGGCHDLLLIAIGGMVADPILVAVIMLTQHTDIYYADVRNIFALHM